ncbi:4-hydroxy-tetrahydrodipicolinate synthase [Allokutzneria albata]|uniref:4-hydroxy-tetrahydrodipicolinate synthase n=1 Tax=Allokutzneria albata TaxID=211114 RepID=A0A1G9X6F9_ALLAB|nr:4-hydroxy-tetrahydrodipicolinate synthase [Allokutzneria albata]SDM92096.1 4-hydroxy-tetrahydrodipicolinate synthase [Allokutzneria albata]
MTGCPTATPGRPFGRVLTAMVTPFTETGKLDLDAAQKLAAHLIASGCDGLVLNGTTGESPTTSDAEKADLVRAVTDAVGGKATIVAGAGTNDTAHSVQQAVAMEKAGAHGLLVVSPYYSRPAQTGLFAHFSAVADASSLPVMLYDIPGRTAVPIEVETLCGLAEHPNIVAVKDAKGDLYASTQVMSRTDLAFYSGDDMINLPWFSVGAVGVVSVVGHVVAGRLREMLDAHERGDVTAARGINRDLLPVYAAFGRLGGVIFSKTALRLRGLPVGEPRLPIPPATAAERDALAADLRLAGLDLAEEAVAQ